MGGAAQTIPSGRAANDANTLNFAQRLQRELASEDGIGPRATFTVSPLASLEDLCTTHDRNYVARYFEGRFTDVRLCFVTRSRLLVISPPRVNKIIISLEIAVK